MDFVFYLSFCDIHVEWCKACIVIIMHIFKFFNSNVHVYIYEVLFVKIHCAGMHRRRLMFNYILNGSVKFSNLVFEMQNHLIDRNCFIHFSHALNFFVPHYTYRTTVYLVLLT